MIKQQLFIGAALLAGVAIGYLAPKGEVAADAGDAAKPARSKGAIANHGDEASVKHLRRRIAELENLLAERIGEESIPTAQTNAVASSPKRFNGPEEWLENLKKNDPERYVQMTNRFAKWRERRNQEAQERIDFLASIDTSRLSTWGRQVHADLQEAICRRDEIDEQLQQPSLSQDERHRLMQDLQQASRDLDQLNRKERNVLIEAAARMAGVKGKQLQEMNATVKEILKQTDTPRMFGPHGGGPHGGGRKR